MTHRYPQCRYPLALAACLLTTLSACSHNPTKPRPPRPPAPTETESAAVNPGKPQPTTLAPQTSAPGIIINREAGTIDLEAKMVNARPDWLELIATTEGPNSRDHEAIVTVTAKPSDIHLALLTLGLKPGHPQVNKHVEGRFVPDPPTGPALQVFFVYEIDGQVIQTPAHQWVLDKATAQPLPDTPWLFTGSQFRQWQGREYYMADENGNAVSLVNFGDDLIVRQTDTTQNNDEQQLQINEASALPYGTPLTLRLLTTPRPDPTPAAETDSSSISP